MITLYHINLATTRLMASHKLDTDHRIITLESSVKVENQPKLTHARESVKVDRESAKIGTIEDNSAAPSNNFSPGKLYPVFRVGIKD